MLVAICSVYWLMNCLGWRSRDHEAGIMVAAGVFLCRFLVI